MVRYPDPTPLSAAAVSSVLLKHVYMDKSQKVRDLILCCTAVSLRFTFFGEIFAYMTVSLLIQPYR